MHAYTDSNWVTCAKTYRTFGGAVICLAGGRIAYKCKFQPTVAGSSTEAKFMAAYNTGTYTDNFVNIYEYVPDSFTTPTCAKAARIHAPLKDNYVGNPWLMVLWHA